MPHSVCEGQRAVFRGQFSPFTLWVPGIKLKLSGGVALIGCVRHKQLSCQHPCSGSMMSSPRQLLNLSYFNNLDTLKECLVIFAKYFPFSVSGIYQLAMIQAPCVIWLFFWRGE